MTPEQIENLAELIVNKLVSKQKELDKEFIKELEESGIPIEVKERLSEEDFLVMQIDNLSEVLDGLIKCDNFEEALICSTKIEDLKDRLFKIKQ